MTEKDLHQIARAQAPLLALAKLSNEDALAVAKATVEILQELQGNNSEPR